MTDLQTMRKMLGCVVFFSLVAGLLLNGCAGAPTRAHDFKAPPLKEQNKPQVSNIEPPMEPILRIETGMHTVQMWRMGVDEAGRRLVTASHDKTVRIWELPAGRLERIIRPPIGEGNEGKLYAATISPDGKTLACSGWTYLGSDTGNTVYLFDADTGRLIQRLTELPNTVFGLAFSRDSSYIAVTLYSDGLRVFRTASGEQVAADSEYDGQSYGVDFDTQGRLATTCLDGYVRLYDRSFRLTAKNKAPGGELPYAVRFSPDGSEIAVGFADVGNVALLSALDLSVIAVPDTTGVVQATLFAVAWSADGKYLYAGGKYSKKRVDGQWQRPIRRWSQAGRGAYEDLFVGAKSTLMDLVSLSDASLVFCSGEPSFGMVSPSGQARLYIGPPIADFRNLGEAFLISPDGATVQFGYEAFGKSPARFTVTKRLLDANPGAAGHLASPLLTAPDLTVTDWDSRFYPKLNGQPLKLERNETSRSLACIPDGESFLLGTEWWIRAYDRFGQERWKFSAPGIAWRVNLSGDGRFAVAAFGDGTIRWYRMTDGKELLSLFPHSDRKRWVMWTPGGYYDASPGGEELIGWHLNRGRDQAADFFPASRFRSTYYRPDVTTRVLETRDVAEALRLANEESGRKRQEAAVETILPPVLTILSPADGAAISRAEVTLSYSVRSPSGEPVTAIRVLVDGRPVSTQRGMTVKASEESPQQIQVTLPERNAEVSLIAENRYAASVPSTIRLTWQGRAVQEAFLVKPKLYVLAIGVSAYEDTGLTLGFAAKDAQDFAGSLERQKGGLYRDVALRVLTDGRATKNDILDGLDWIQRETTSKDIAMVFLAGHGVNDQAGIYYFLPVNADTERLKRTGVSFSDIKNTVASLAGKVLLFVDTCHSGNVMGTRRGVVDITAVVNELASAENGVVVFASSTGRQYSLEDPAWGNGAFTKALVEGVSGRADYHGKGRITINMLDLYLSERVKELTRGQQTPTTTKPQTIPDFPVAMKR